MKQPPYTNLNWLYAEPVIRYSELEVPLFLRASSSYHTIEKLRTAGVTISKVDSAQGYSYLDIKMPSGWEMQRGVHGAVFIVDAQGYTVAFFSYVQNRNYKGLSTCTQWFWVGSEA